MQVCAQLLKQFGAKTYYELNAPRDDEQGMPMIVVLFWLRIMSVLTLGHISGGDYGDQEQVHADDEQVDDEQGA